MALIILGSNEFLWAHRFLVSNSLSKTKKHHVAYSHLPNKQAGCNKRVTNRLQVQNKSKAGKFPEKLIRILIGLSWIKL